MAKKIPVLYGRNYKVVLAIVLPSLLIAPFIWGMQFLQPMNDLQLYLIIFAFLGCIISFSVWLAMRVYPPTLLNISNDEISLSFDPSNFLSPSDFSFKIADITSFTKHDLRGDEYFVFETKNPNRKFQLSAPSYKVEDLVFFSSAMAEISEYLNQH